METDRRPRVTGTGVSSRTIRRPEENDHAISACGAAALEGGVRGCRVCEFIGDNDSGAGVRFRRRP
jgi:hypothetical protein